MPETMQRLGYMDKPKEVPLMLREQVASGEIDGVSYSLAISIPPGRTWVEFEVGKRRLVVEARHDLTNLLQEAYEMVRSEVKEGK